MFYGVATALVTPFRDGALDEAAFEKLLAYQLDNGVHGLVPCGSTGESSFLTSPERDRLITLTLQVTKGRIPVIAGTGAVSTAETVQLTQQAQKLGADGALIVVPPYIKPSQAGLYKYFKTVHDSCDIPVILYDNPGRSVVGLSNDTIWRLAELPRIVALKDASADLAKPAVLRKNLPADFKLYSGEDATAPAFLAEGGDGCISVTANVAPKLCAELQNAWKRQDLEAFSRLRNMMSPLHKALFVESNPVPVKCAVSLLGLCDPTPREPLLPAISQTETLLREVMTACELLK